MKPCYSCDNRHSILFCEKMKCWLSPTKKKEYSWLKSYREIMTSWIFERFDKNCQIPCFKRG